MDDIVKQAIAKWPNVPHCYGWLALDARGHWRMRDERAQAHNLPGEKIVHPALLAFIKRNYGQDQDGCYYFQNGPQRVYVDLETTPYIVRTDPENGLIDQTDHVFSDIDAVWMTEKGQLLFQAKGIVAMLDDRDIAQCISLLQMDGATVSDELLLRWLTDQAGTLTFCCDARLVPVTYILSDTLADFFAYVRTPRAPK